MVHLYRYIILIISLCTTQLVSAYGLRFRGAASPIDERTSYDVFAHSCPSFKDYFDLEFNMALYSTESVGYVLRVKGADEGQIFNLFFDFRGDDILFRLNQEGKCVLIALPVSKAEAMKSHWFKVKIAFRMRLLSKFTIKKRYVRGCCSLMSSVRKSCSVRATTSLTFRR